MFDIPRMSSPFTSGKVQWPMRIVADTGYLDANEARMLLGGELRERSRREAEMGHRVSCLNWSEGFLLIKG